MPTIVVGLPNGERVHVTALVTEWDRDDSLTLTDSDGTEVAEFPDACYAVRKDDLVE